MRRRVLTAFTLCAAAAVTFALAVWRPGLFSGWFPAWSRGASAALSYVTGFIPFSVGELLAAALIVSGAVYWIRAVIRGTGSGRWGDVARELLNAAAVTLIWSGGLALVFLWLWGINYFMPALSTRMGLERRPQSARVLTEAAYVLLDELNQLAPEVDRRDDLTMAPPSFWDARRGVAQGYESLAEQYPFITPYGAAAKRVTLGTLLSYAGISGVYTPWTAECNVNPDTPWPNIAATMAHETAHRQGAAHEDDASFVGILACRESDDVNVRYSGAFVAFIYVYNALYREDYQAFSELYGSIDPAVIADMALVTEHYKRYEGPVSDAGEAVNDAYLKAMQQEEGVKSYGMVADLLIAELISSGKIPADFV